MTDISNFSKLKPLIAKEITALQSAFNAQSDSAEIVILDQACTGRITRMDALQQRAQLRLKQLQAALVRIDNLDYGCCKECDEEISLARLQANPVALLCIECAQQQERS